MKRFSSTIGYTGDRELLVNADRVLYVELLTAPDRYVVYFDTGQEIEVEAVSGKILVQHLQRDGESHVPAPQISLSPAPLRPRGMR